MFSELVGKPRSFYSDRLCCLSFTVCSCSLSGTGRVGHGNHPVLLCLWEGKLPFSCWSPALHCLPCLGLIPFQIKANIRDKDLPSVSSKIPLQIRGLDGVLCGKDHFQHWALNVEPLFVLQTQSSISSTTSSLWGVYPHYLHLEMSQSLDRGMGLIPNWYSTFGTRLQKALSAKAKLGLMGGPV